uniref:dynamin family protein n=1 Tax=uncultured Bilophila sp. TaxID=529385 RepID=UPI0025F4BEA9|nr:dynamin family protein [uncultured Bilophila sp.]
MSSRPTSASMLSMLPQPIQPIPGDSFNDRILLLLAAVASTDGMLTYREYQLVQEAAEAIFGERALHAELQAKLHYALLNPPSDPAEIARDMANQADAQKVSSTFVDTMLKALSLIGGHEERVDEKAQSLVNDIEWAFRKSRLERSAGRGIGLGLNVGESLGGLYRMATSVLPSRKDIANWFAPETTQFNADMEHFASSLDRIAWTLDDMDLREELYLFRKMLRRQPFKIVIVGERKRGKSSLINAIIGQELSPVRESTPETATVVEFRYAHAPDYSVRFLDSSQFARLEDYLENEQDNLLLTRKIEHIRKGVADGTFIPGKLLSGITCWDDLSDYISLEGRFSGFVARVSVGLPLDTLRSGVVLVDTPGLNDTDRFHDYLSYEESLEADCVIFVMDARDPGSNSELSLLRKLARSGRTVSIIGVLTNIDRLNSAASLELAREQARTVLREACRSSGQVELAGVVALNTRQAVEERCRNKTALADTLKVSRSVSGELEQLLSILREVMDRDTGKEAYRRKIAEAYSRIADSARERLRRHVQEYRDSLPSPELLGMLDAHAKQLSAAALSSLEQARQVVDAAAKDLDAWDVATEKALEKFRETLVLRLMDAVGRKVSELGHQFAKDAVWKEFDATEARTIARRAVDEFLEEQRGILRGWEDKLRLFSARMDEFSQECLARLSSNIDGLQDDPGEVNGTSSAATHFLVQTHRHMKNLAVFTTGLTVGRLTALGPISILVTAGNILALATASPFAAAVVAAVAGTAGLLYHLGREDKRKAAFLDKRRRDAEEYADRICDALRQELGGVREDLGKAYEFEVKRGFAPALESLFHQSVHLRLFLDVMQKIRSDVSRYDEHVQKQLEELGGVLNQH